MSERGFMSTAFFRAFWPDAFLPRKYVHLSEKGPPRNRAQLFETPLRGGQKPQRAETGALWDPPKKLKAPQGPPRAPKEHQKSTKSPEGRFRSYPGKTFMELQSGPFFSQALSREAQKRSWGRFDGLQWPPTFSKI